MLLYISNNTGVGANACTGPGEHQTNFRDHPFVIFFEQTVAIGKLTLSLFECYLFQRRKMYGFKGKKSIV